MMESEFIIGAQFALSAAAVEVEQTIPEVIASVNDGSPWARAYMQCRAADKGRVLVLCDWTYEGETCSFETSCGHAFKFIDDGIEENGFKFCPYCGKAINETKPNEED